MNIFQIITLVCFAFSLCVNSLYAQIKISGTIKDKTTKETMIGSNVVIKGTTIGTTTDLDGNFTIEVDSLPVKLQISFIGYGKQEITVKDANNPLNINMEMTAFAGQEVVVSASRVSETIMESAISVQKMNTKQIQEAASGDFYQDLGSLKGVDVTSASMGFKVINTRGFNTTSPIRSVQFIDGMDNQAPGLNFPVGNLLGASALDLDNVELISGAASALYGPNAMQGVISMTTQDPFEKTGLSAMVKGGGNNLLEGNFRYANTLDKKKKLALKLTFSHFQAEDWEASDSIANRYGDILVEDIDLSSIISQGQYDMSLTQKERDDFIALNNYLGLVSPGAAPGKIDIQAPGYMESELADYATRSTKLGASLAYKLNDSLKASYDYKYGTGTAIYQGTNRYSINNIRFHQHKLELSGKQFTLKAYTTIENAGDSYDIKFTGINMSKGAITDYVGEYLSAYLDSTAGLKIMTQGFDDEAKPWMVDSAHRYALTQAEKMWYQTGTSKFDSAYQAVITNPDLQNGSKFVDASALQHFEGQYNFDFDFADVITGASFRRYDPNSYGTIFEDTLINPGDTLANGQNDFDADFVDIASYEYGAYAQATKRIMNNKLKLSASFRADKSKNYDLQMSPRISGVYKHKDHHFRLAAQSAFRSPTLQNQFLLIDLGPIILTGNLNGSGNLSQDGNPVVFYTLESVKDFTAMYDSVGSNNNYIGEVKPGLLDTITLAPIKPEQVKTIEAGYKGILFSGLYVDLNVYYSQYASFIGDIRVVRPDGNGVAGEESGMDAILTKAYQPYQIPVNAKEEVTTYGGGIGLAYYFGRIMAKANYTYSLMDTAGLTDPILPGFNTPKHKFNIGLVGTRVWKELGCSFNYKWVEGFRWESSFGDGNVPSYSVLDAQVNYHFKDLSSTLRIGASNLLENQHLEAYGSPFIGRLFYASWTFKFDEF